MIKSCCLLKNNLQLVKNMCMTNERNDVQLGLCNERNEVQQGLCNERSERRNWACVMSAMRRNGPQMDDTNKV